MRRMCALVAAVLALAGCASVDSSTEGLSPSQASRLASEASKAASQAAEEAVEGLVVAKVAEELDAVALAVKAYSDLGATLQGEEVNQRTLATINDGIAEAQKAADIWTAYANGIPSSAVSPALRADIDTYTAALQGYLDAQATSSVVWQDCIDQFGNRQLEVSTCIVTTVDSDELLSTFDDYVAALKDLAAELGIRIS